MPTVAGQIIRSRLIPDGKKVVPYSIQTLKRLGLEEAADAHELLSDGSLTGRIMLTMN